MAAIGRVGCSRATARAIFCTQRSEEHTSELQSLTNLVCRLLLEKKKRGGDARRRSIRLLDRGPCPARKHASEAHLARRAYAGQRLPQPIQRADRRTRRHDYVNRL